MNRRRVVITGIGSITAVGYDSAELWDSISNGVNGIGPISLYDCSDMKVKLAAEAKKFDPEEYMDKREARKLDRSSQLALAVGQQAVKMSKIDIEKEDPYRCAVIFATGIGGISTLQSECEKGYEKGYDRVSPFFIPMSIANMPAGNLAIAHGFKGACTCPVTACASATNAIGDAMRHIADGYAEVVLCGGAEAAITSFGIGGFTSLRALSTTEDVNRASIPFDAERSGFVMGEGAGALVLEDYDHAIKRGATILGEVVGYGMSCDAHHITAPDPQGLGAAHAMKQAVESAGIEPHQLGYINTHGTSTPLNDAAETMAIKEAFGDHAYRLAISSTKSMTGHLLGAAGAVEGIITSMALQNGFLPPTINYKNPDPQCDLDVVPNEGRSTDTEYGMSTSLGFGGHNACVVFKKY